MCPGRCSKREVHTRKNLKKTRQGKTYAVKLHERRKILATYKGLQYVYIIVLPSKMSYLGVHI